MAAVSSAPATAAAAAWMILRHRIQAPVLRHFARLSPSPPPLRSLQERERATYLVNLAEHEGVISPGCFSPPKVSPARLARGVELAKSCVRARNFLGRAHATNRGAAGQDARSTQESRSPSSSSSASRAGQSHASGSVTHSAAASSL
ncbi:hypothetical protein KSP40_PGU005786 [Platanthera guangdongensis]|uniref:Uncharacterized protein n=1 Tax=Platanthera guangdongensis TaxID=2320717 RepID=A0ABR2LS89_9ASPA